MFCNSIIFKELIEKTTRLKKKKKNQIFFTSKFFIPVKIIVAIIKIEPEKKIDKKHHGQGVFKISSKI